MSYKKVGWEDSPSSNTPILSVSLNQMDDGIEKANKGIVFGYSATFTSDGVLKNTTSTEALGTGSFATSQTDIVTVFVADNVTKIDNGTFSNCTSLKTIYIDNKVGNVDVVSGAVPSGVSIVYSDDENFINVNELLASAIKSLKVQANTDRQNFNKSVDEINTKLETKENVSNKVSVITHPSLDYYPDTKAVFDYVNSKFTDPLADIEALKESRVTHLELQTVQNNLNVKIDTNKSAIDDLQASKVDNTEFNNYKVTNDTEVKTNSTDITAVKADVYDNAIKVTTDKSTSVAITDSSDKNILKLVCDSEDYQVKLYKKNLFDINKSKCNINVNSGAKTTLVDRENNVITFTTINNINSGIYLRHIDLSEFNKGYGIDYTKLANKIVTLSFDCQADVDAQMIVQLVSAKQSKINITTNKTRYSVSEIVDVSKLNKAITFYFNNVVAEVTISNIQIEVNNVATDYEKCEFQSVDKSTDMTTVHSYYPTTTVIADSDFQLTYIADTKNYIDNKLNEIATALVAHESEVI